MTEFVEMLRSLTHYTMFLLMLSLSFSVLPTGEGGHISLDLLELLLLLLQGLGGLQQLVVRLVEPNLELLHFLTIISDVAFSLGEIMVYYGLNIFLFSIKIHLICWYDKQGL